MGTNHKYKVLELAHRIAWRYKKSSDPAHSDTFTFNESTLLQFVGALAQQAVPSAFAQASEMLTTYVEAIKASGDYERWHYIPEVEDVAAMLAAAPAAPAAPQAEPQHDDGAAEAGHAAAAGHLAALVDEAQRILADLHQYAIDLQDDTLGGRSERGEVPIMDLAEDWLAARPDLEPQEPQMAAPQAEQQAGQAPAPAPVEMSPEFTDSARAALLWVLWHHQGGSSPVGQPIRFALGMGAHDHLNEHQIGEAKRWAGVTGWTTERVQKYHPSTAAPADQSPGTGESAMKINVIGMILNNAGRRCFEGALLDDAGKPMSAADSLHTLMVEYAKVVNGGTSSVVVASREVSAAFNPSTSQGGKEGA